MKTSKIFSLILVLSLMFSLAIFNTPTAYADCGGGDDCTCCGCGGKGTCGDSATTSTVKTGGCAEALLNETRCTGPLRITKQPTSETKLGSDGRTSTCFVVRGENIAWVEWYCRIGSSGEVMSVEEAIGRYGISASGYDTTVLYIERGSSWWNINGWEWTAILYDCEGNCIKTVWVTTLAENAVEPAPCVPCAPPCAPVAPPCTAPATPCAPAWGCGYGFTEIESVTTSYSETASIEHSYGIRYW